MTRTRAVCAFTALGFLLACAPARAQSSQQAARIKVETNLVNVLTSVLDKNGRPVVDLPKEVFQVYEEDVPQRIDRFEAETSQPLDLALMVDTSLSTLKDLKFEGEAAAHFVRQVVRPGDKLAVFEFSDVVTQLSEFSSDVPTLQAAARGIDSGAGTSLYDAVVLGSRMLSKRPATERRRVIVLVTDAGETTSASNFEETRHAAIASQALLYTIVIRPIKSESGRNTAGEHALETITDSTGGAMYYLDELGQLDAMFDRIDRELRTQYLLGYYPDPRPPAGSYRHIDVRVNGGYALHYRKAYFAAGKAQ